MSRVGEHMASREGITHIVRNLRPRDREEIFALRWDDDEEQFVEDCFRVAGPLWRVWSWDGEPVAIVGVVPLRPGVVLAGAFGTEKWRFTLRAMMHWVRFWLIPALQRADYHRGEAYALASNRDARRWIEAMGGQIEGHLSQYGRRGEDFLLYHWRLNDVFWWGQERQQQRADNVDLRLH